MHNYVTVYKCKQNKIHSVISKPVASKQIAIDAFNTETNSLNSFKFLYCIKITN
jgi:hypothetical protein